MLVLITERPSIAKDLTKALHDRDVYLFCVPYETALFTCDKKDTGGVIIDCVPSLKAGEELCVRLRDLYSEMPIAAIVKAEDIPQMPVDFILRDTAKGAPTEGMQEECYEFCRLCGWNERPLSCHDLMVGRRDEAVYYMGYALPLAPMEKELLHCLFYRYPRVTDADDLLTLCAPFERISRSALSVWISNINRKARLLDPRPLILCQYGKGYRLRDYL